MLKFDENLRAPLADKALDAANIAAGALVFGQALGERSFSIPLALLGLSVWIGFVTLGSVLAQRRNR
jgi:hypothetical protein